MATPTETHPLLETIAEMTADSIAHTTLDAQTLMLVRFAALAAADAPPLSYVGNLKAGAEVELTLEDAQAVLVAIAPIVGTARVVAATGNVMRALGIAIAVDESESPGSES